MESAEEHEQGGILIMALIFISVMGLVIGAVVQLAAVDIRNTSGTRTQRNVVYAADAGVQAAINAYRQTSTCLGSPPVVNGTNVVVTCQVATSSGSGGAATNQPPLAVITLPSTGETGVTLASGANTNIGGGIYSNTDIKVPGGASLTVSGPTTARTGCNGAGTYVFDPTATNNCNLGTGSYAAGTDPSYSPAISSASPPVTVPSCPASGPVTMPVGSYTDGTALNNLFSACAGRVFYFPSAPGGAAYYFDFKDGGSHTWTIDNPSTVVVGGTLPAGQTLATIASVSPGSRCDDQANGVQFIFGGDSRIAASAGSVDLCAQHDPTQTKQEIAMYGLSGTYAPPPSPTDLPSVAPATSSGTDYTNPDLGRLEDNQVATATVTSTVAAGKTIGLQGFDVSGIPSGSTINSVKLRVVHQDHPGDPAWAGNLTLSATVAGTGASTTINDKACGSACLTEADSLHADVADISSTFTSLSKLQNLQVSYLGTAKKKGSTATSFTESLDGVALLVNYTPPASSALFERQSGCITVAPYNSPGSCALITTSGAQTNFSVNGTVYAPLAAFDIQLTNVAYRVFGRGIVARSLTANLTSSSTCSGSCSPFRLPPAAPSPGTTAVVFQASVGTNKRLRALVSFPSSGGAPTVQSWSVVNQ